MSRFISIPSLLPRQKGRSEGDKILSSSKSVVHSAIPRSDIYRLFSLLMPRPLLLKLVESWILEFIRVENVSNVNLNVSLSMGHGLDRLDPSTHVDRSEILARP